MRTEIEIATRKERKMELKYVRRVISTYQVDVLLSILLRLRLRISAHRSEIFLNWMY